MRHSNLAVSLAALLAACSQPATAPAQPEAGASVTTTAENAMGADAAAEAPVSADPVNPQIPPSAPAEGEQGGASDWREIVSAEDAGRLSRLDQAWRLGRAEAMDHGFADQVKALGALGEPDAGQAGRLQPPPGSYNCRTIKLGTRNEGQGLPFLSYPGFRCTVELTPGGDLILTKTTGSQRTRGLLYPDTDNRLVFVGAQAWGADETGYPRYGQTPERNQVGVFERIGSNRWRLVIPFPRQESKIDILELTR